MAEPARPVQLIHRVLVVEDDHQLADLLSEVLTYENCATEIAANGMEAMEKLRGADFDAIVCDLMMPRVDGEALYNDVVRSFPYLADRFLFVTGQASRKAGFSDFVTRTGNNLIEKPFDIHQFRGMVRELFKR